MHRLSAFDFRLSEELQKANPKRALIALVLLAAPAVSAAPQAADAGLVERVQRFYEKTRDFSADFEQEYRYEAMGRTEKSSGTVQVKKPGLMRWDYAKPWPRRFVLDGKSLYVHDVEDNSVTIKRDFASDSLSAAVTFLWGKGRLGDEFLATKVDRPEYGAAVLELVPKKPQPGFRKVFFAVDPATGAVVASVVVDSQGNENRISFRNVRANQGVPDARFRFEIPRGATVEEVK